MSNKKCRVCGDQDAVGGDYLKDIRGYANGDERELCEDCIRYKREVEESVRIRKRREAFGKNEMWGDK